MSVAVEQTEDQSPLAPEQGDFSPFYYALLKKQQENGYSNLIINAAYGIYKTEKQKEIERLRTNTGKDPDRKDLMHFVEIAISSIDHYINSAAEDQKIFTQIVIDSLNEQEDRHIVNVAKNITPMPWYTTVFWGVVGNMAWTLLLAVLSWYGALGKTIQAAVHSLNP